MLNLKISCDNWNDTTKTSQNEHEAKAHNTFSRIENSLKELNFICMNTNTAFIVCHSGYDIAQYIYSLSRYEMSDEGDGKLKISNAEEQFIETLCNIEKVNRTDAANLLSNFQDIKSVCTASTQLLNLVPGINEKKIKSIDEFFNFEFNSMN